LAPFEMVHPWWGRGFYGGSRGGINVTNANILSSYRNARVANAVAGVSAADFTAGRFHNISRVGGEQIRNAGLVRGQLPVTPTSANLRYTNRAVGNVPHSSENVRFFNHDRTTPVQRVPFSEQQRSMQQMSRQSAASAASTGGWRRYEGGASPGSGSARTAPSTTDRSNGWQRFGEPRAASNGWNSGTARSGGAQPGGSTYRPYSAPSSNYNGRYNGPQALRITPNVVHERSAPRTQTQSAPRSSSSTGGGSGSHVSRGGGGGGGGSHGGGRR
jgi:hypothetical protein